MIVLLVLALVGVLGGVFTLTTSPNLLIAGLMMVIGFGGVAVFALVSLVRRRKQDK